MKFFFKLFSQSAINSLLCYRFGGVESRGCRLFTTSNPVGGGKESQGWIHSWDEGKVSKAVSIPEPTSALAVRDDGTFLAIGTMFTGSVSVYIAFSLQV